MPCSLCSQTSAVEAPSTEAQTSAQSRMTSHLPLHWFVFLSRIAFVDTIFPYLRGGGEREREKKTKLYVIETQLRHLNDPHELWGTHYWAPFSHQGDLIPAILDNMGPSSIGKRLAVPSGICHQLAQVSKRGNQGAVSPMGLQEKNEDKTTRLRFVPHYCSDLDRHLKHFSPTPSTHHIFFCRTEKLQAGGLVQLGEYLHKRGPGFHL